MRRYLAFLILTWIGTGAAIAAPLDFPALTGRVVDEAQVLDAGTRQELDQILAQHEQGTGEQIVVVTLRDLRGQQIEEYGYQLGRQWGIGQKGKDNGALLIVAPAQHRTRIEVGYGLEGKLTDAASSAIIQSEMIPHFKVNDYSGGVRAGVQAMLAVLGGRDAVVPQHRAAESGSPSMLLALLIAFFVFFMLRRMGGGTGNALLLGSMLGGGSSSGGGGGFSGGGGSFGGGGSSGGW